MQVELRKKERFIIYNESRPLLAPEFKLWASVLKLAIREAIEGTEDRQRQAVRWLFSNKRRVGSFYWITEQLGIEDRAALRRLAWPSSSKALTLAQRKLFRG